MPVRAWFPTLVYDAPLAGGRAGAALRRDVLRECLTLREIDDPGRRWSRENYAGGYTSYDSHHRLHQSSPVFAEVERRLARHVAAFARALDWDLRGRKLEMTDCWVNVLGPGGMHGLHLHPLASVSGTYYVRVPKGASQIRFEDPRLASFMGAPPRKTAPRAANLTSVRYSPADGRVILFESWLRHEVVPNRAKGERVSVSFNFDWR